MPIGSAAKPKAAARRRGGDCAASESSGRVRARRIRPVRRLRRHWSRAPALWQLCGKRASCVPIHLVGSSHERSARTCRAAQAHELVRAWERGSERASWGHTVVIHQPDAQRPTNTDRCGGRLEESQVRDGRDVRPVLPAVRVRAAVSHIPRACRHRERRRHKAACCPQFLSWPALNFQICEAAKILPKTCCINASWISCVFASAYISSLTVFDEKKKIVTGVQVLRRPPRPLFTTCPYRDL